MGLNAPAPAAGAPCFEPSPWQPPGPPAVATRSGKRQHKRSRKSTAELFEGSGRGQVEERGGAAAAPKRARSARRRAGEAAGRGAAVAMRQKYDPFLQCGKHELCQLRAQLSVEDLRAGGHYVAPDADSVEVLEPQYSEAPGQRVDHVEDDADGIANLMQLHLVRASTQLLADRRPLLLPDVQSGKSPVWRVLTSKRFFGGRFFNADGTCQCDDCVMVVFPKNHRGDVRLQLKVWNTEMERISSTTTKDDTKAHYLSYLLWLYGASTQAASELGQFPCTAEASCAHGSVRGKFQDQEFLCINPMHYCRPTDREAFAAEIAAAVGTCLRDADALPGERPREGAAGRSCCFCPKCRAAGFKPG